MVVVVAVWKKDTPMLKKINHSQNLMWRKRKRTSSKLTYDDDDNIALFCDELQRSSDHRLIHLSHLIVYYPLVCSIDKRWCQCNRLSLERKRLWFSFSPVQQKFTHQKKPNFLSNNRSMKTDLQMLTFDFVSFTFYIFKLFCDFSLQNQHKRLRSEQNFINFQRVIGNFPIIY